MRHGNATRLVRWLTLAAVALAAAGCAGTPETRSGTQEQLRAAQSTLESFVGDPEMTWLRENLPRSRAVLVIPRLTRGALGVGGAAGEALAFAKDESSGAWRGPALTAVVRNMVEQEGTFDKEGWLRLGAVGYQPGLEETYNATGSLYVCLTGLVHLGLPPDDPFWTARATDWTQKKIWSGQDVAGDHALPTTPTKGKLK